MKSFAKVLLFFAGLAISISGACAVIYKFFKKHCKIQIEFNPSEENSRECECDEEHCEICNPVEEACEENSDTDDIEFTLSEEDK